MPFVPFRTVRVGYAEIAAYAVGMKPPQVGEIIKRDATYGRVTRSTARPPTQADADIFDRIFGPMDVDWFVAMIEWEPLHDDHKWSVVADEWVSLRHCAECGLTEEETAYGWSMVEP